MMPYDLPLHAGIMPRLLITIVGEPTPGADRYDHHSSSNSMHYDNPATTLILQIMAVLSCSACGSHWSNIFTVFTSSSPFVLFVLLIGQWNSV